MADDTVTFSIGQVVPWPPAPLGFAQVSDLYRTKVQLCYPFKNGRVARPVVRAADLADLQRRTPLLLDLHNPYDRGVVARSRTFVICAPPPVAHLPSRRREASSMKETPANELTACCVIFAVGAALDADLAVVANLQDEARTESPLDAEVYLAFLEFAQRVKALERRREAGHGQKGQA